VSAPLRAMVVSPYSLSYVGGVQGQVLGLARALRTLGVDARIVAPCDGPPPEPGIATVGPSTRISSNGSIAPIASGSSVARRTLEVLRDFEPSVVHLHEPLVPGTTQAALLGADAPLVGTFHAAAAEGSPWYRAFRPPLRRWIQRLAVRTAVSEEACRLAREAFGGDYEVLPNGVEVERYAWAQPWPSDKPAILFIGRHEPRKGLEVLLDSFAGLEPGSAVLWAAGDGPETARLRARGIAGVEWLGRIDETEKARRLRGATVYCAPSLRGESFGVVLLEAMAARVAAIASDLPGYRSVARPDQEALIVPPGDVDSLRGALSKLLADEALRDRLANGGVQRADELSMRRLAERFLPVYDRAIRIGPAGG
jgi:phosphatidyl-myo-inositol alpha-mannosyltransferase